MPLLLERRHRPRALAFHQEDCLDLLQLLHHQEVFLEVRQPQPPAPISLEAHQRHREVFSDRLRLLLPLVVDCSDRLQPQHHQEACLGRLPLPLLEVSLGRRLPRPRVFLVRLRLLNKHWKLT